MMINSVSFMGVPKKPYPGKPQIKKARYELKNHIAQTSKPEGDYPYDPSAGGGADMGDGGALGAKPVNNNFNVWDY